MTGLALLRCTVKTNNNTKQPTTSVEPVACNFCKESANVHLFLFVLRVFKTVF